MKSISEEEAIMQFEDSRRLKKLSVSQIIDEPQRSYAQEVIQEVATPQYRAEARKRTIARQLKRTGKGLALLKPVRTRPIISKRKSKAVGTAVKGLLGAFMPSANQEEQMGRQMIRPVGRPKGVYTIELINGKPMRISSADFRKYKQEKKRAEKMKKLYAMAREQQQKDYYQAQAEETARTQDQRFQPDYDEQRFLSEQDPNFERRLQYARAINQQKKIIRQQPRTRNLLSPISSMLGRRGEPNLLNQPVEIEPQRRRGAMSPEEILYLRKRWSMTQSQPNNTLSLVGTMGRSHATPQLDFLGRSEKSILKKDDDIIQQNLYRNAQRGFTPRWF